MSGVSKTSQILERISTLERVYLRDVAYSIGLNLRQLEVLLYLARCNRYSDTPLAVAEYLGLTKGTVSQSILTLESKGFIKKSPDKQDKRVVHLELLSKAKKVVEQCLENSPLSKNLTNISRDDQLILKNTAQNLLRTIQHNEEILTFGVCQTCQHFNKNGLGSSHQCGLTGEPLSKVESLKICIEHLEPDDT